MCRYHEAQAQWLKKGYPGMDLCRGLCGLDDWIRQCQYRKQSNRKEKIIFGMHQHLTQGLGIQDFDAVVVLPYAMPLTNMAAWAAPDNVVLWPCLHDEPYAYLEPVRLLLESVRGVMFNSPEEGDLARQRLRIAPRRAVVLGEGVTLDPPSAPPPVASRDLLFIGRLEPGKNLSLLYDYVQRYAASTDATIAAGFMLEADRDAVIAKSDPSRIPE